VERWRHFRVFIQAWKDHSEKLKGLTGKRKRGTETEFLPEALEIVETPPSPIGRLILWVIMLAFVFTIAWAWFGKVDIVAVAQGKVVSEGQTKTLEAPETGIVREIFIKNGDKVKAGDVLLKLDPTIASADSETVRKERQQAELRAAIAKGVIKYLDTGEVEFVPPKETPTHIVTVSERQLQSRLDAYETEHSVLLEDIKQAQASRRSLGEEINKLQKLLPLLQNRVNLTNGLAAKGFVSRMEATRLEEELIIRRSEYSVAKERVNEIRAAIVSSNRKATLLGRQLKRDALTELAEAEAIVAERTEAEKKASVRNAWQTLRAPVDGTVLSLSVFTIGEVVEAGSPILLVAPVNDELVVEAMILNKDIGFVQEGDGVSVKIEAFPFTRYGLVEGILENISADAVADERIGLVYAARITLKEPYVGKGNFRRPLTSGMNATAEVKTGKRRIIDFILSPIAKASHEAGRER